MRSIKTRPIGIFDSGLGGLTVAKSIRKYLPEEDIIYFGDTARVPYGNKSKSTIIRFAREIMDFLVSKKVKMAVVACNTVSSLSITALKNGYSIPIVGVIKPGVKEAVRFSKSKRVGVIGTRSTIASRAYDKELLRVDESYRLFSKYCPLFVPLVENRLIDDDITCAIVKRDLAGLKTKHIDTLILGCTHYPVLKDVIKKVMKGVHLVDSSRAIVKDVREILLKNNMENHCGRHRGTMKCFVSDNVEEFRSAAGIFLREKINVKKVVL